MMKKLMLFAVAAMFMVAGCEEKKPETVAEQPKPATEQPAAKPAAQPAAKPAAQPAAAKPAAAPAKK